MRTNMRWVSPHPPQIAREAGYDVIQVGRDAVTILGGSALPADAKVVFFGAPMSSIKAPSAQVHPFITYLQGLEGHATVCTVR